MVDELFKEECVCACLCVCMCVCVRVSEYLSVCVRGCECECVSICARFYVSVWCAHVRIYFPFKNMVIAILSKCDLKHHCNIRRIRDLWGFF